MEHKYVLDEIYKVVADNNYNLYHIWASQIVFSWRWWLNVVLSILPWVLWIKIRDKKNTARLLFVGLTTALVTNALDVIGIAYGLWHYDWKIFPFTPMYIPWDFTLFPVTIMLILQVKPETSAFVKALFFSVLCSFILEPLFSWIDMYHMVHWEFWYSFIIYIPLFLFFSYLYNSKLLQVYQS